MNWESGEQGWLEQIASYLHTYTHMYRQHPWKTIRILLFWGSWEQFYNAKSQIKGGISPGHNRMK